MALRSADLRTYLFKESTTALSSFHIVEESAHRSSGSEETAVFILRLNTHREEKMSKLAFDDKILTYSGALRVSEADGQATAWMYVTYVTYAQIDAQ